MERIEFNEEIIEIRIRSSQSNIIYVSKIKK